MISKNDNYPRRKIMGLSVMLSSIHAGTSILLAAGIAFLSLFFLRQFSSYLNYAAAAMMMIIGAYFIINGFSETLDETSFVKYSFILGVSASPDLSLLPILLASGAYPLEYSEIIMLVFALISIISLVLIVIAADIGIGNSLKKIEPKYMDYLMGLILIGIGVFLIFQ